MGLTAFALRPKRRRRPRLVAARQVGPEVRFVCIVFMVFRKMPCNPFCNPRRRPTVSLGILGYACSPLGPLAQLGERRPCTACPDDGHPLKTQETKRPSAERSATPSTRRCVRFSRLGSWAAAGVALALPAMPPPRRSWRPSRAPDSWGASVEPCPCPLDRRLTQSGNRSDVDSRSSEGSLESPKCRGRSCEFHGRHRPMDSRSSSC